MSIEIHKIVDFFLVSDSEASFIFSGFAGYDNNLLGIGRQENINSVANLDGQNVPIP